MRDFDIGGFESERERQAKEKDDSGDRDYLSHKESLSLDAQFGILNFNFCFVQCAYIVLLVLYMLLFFIPKARHGSVQCFCQRCLSSD